MKKTGFAGFTRPQKFAASYTDAKTARPMVSSGDSVALNLAVSVGRACAICDMRATDDMYSTMLALPTLVRAVSFRARREKRNCEQMMVENARNAAK